MAEQEKIPLRDIDHPYYAADCNYYSNDQTWHAESWDEFIAQRGEEDHDLNLLVRWDYKRHEEGDILQLIYILQRKGIYQVNTIKIQDIDEAKIRAFLAERWEKLRELWSSFSGAEIQEKDCEDL